MSGSASFIACFVYEQAAEFEGLLARINLNYA